MVAADPAAIAQQGRPVWWGDVVCQIVKASNAGRTGVAGSADTASTRSKRNARMVSAFRRTDAGQASFPDALAAPARNVSASWTRPAAYGAGTRIAYGSARKSVEDANLAFQAVKARSVVRTVAEGPVVSVPRDTGVRRGAVANRIVRARPAVLTDVTVLVVPAHRAKSVTTHMSASRCMGAFLPRRLGVAAVSAGGVSATRIYTAVTSSGMPGVSHYVNTNVEAVGPTGASQTVQTGSVAGTNAEASAVSVVRGKCAISTSAASSSVMLVEVRTVAEDGVALNCAVSARSARERHACRCVQMSAKERSVGSGGAGDPAARTVGAHFHPRFAWKVSATTTVPTSPG